LINLRITAMPCPGGPEVGGLAAQNLLDADQLTAADAWLSEAIAALPDDTGQFVDREVRRGHRPARRHPRRRPAGAGQPRSGALAGMLAGSVAQRCVHHPICPLVLVPAGRGSRMMEP
jgi:hypothetical protein